MLAVRYVVRPAHMRGVVLMRPAMATQFQLRLLTVKKNSTTSTTNSSTSTHDQHKQGNIDHSQQKHALGTPSASTSSSSKETVEKKSSFNLKTVLDGLKGAADATMDMIKNPRQTWQMIKDVAHHYWVGSKLLWTEIKMTKDILGRVLQGSSMTRRERNQLIRTTTDIFRLVPFAIFVIVPFMELLLPFALKLFPNMLPSTFQDELKKEETLKHELQMRLAVAGFLQETLQELTLKRAKASGVEAGEVIEFIEKARLGEPLPNDSVIRIAKLFKDEFTLANIPRPQLVSMCKYMGLHPYGGDSFLRFQLRNQFRSIKDDDRRILWEGLDSLTMTELREACQARGMRAHGLPSTVYNKQLKEWLDLSIQKDIPISLLIMSRAFSITSSAVLAEDVLKSSISSLDSDTINEVVISAASAAEEKTLDIQKRKLESLQFQKEMIEEELEESEEVNNRRQAAAAAAAAAASKPLELEATVNSNTSNINDNSTSSTVASATLSADDKNVTTTTGSGVTLTTNSASTSVPVNNAAAVVAAPVSAPASAPLELSASEIEAIGDLTRDSGVQRERAKLAIIEAKMDAVEAADAVAQDQENLLAASASRGDGEDNAASAAAAAMDAVADKSIDQMKSVLHNMVDKLKLQVSKTEKELGDKFKLLDLDGDGELSAAELKEAIMKILKRSCSEEEIEEFIQLLDRDRDGKVSVIELLRYAEEKRRSEELRSFDVTTPLPSSSSTTTTTTTTTTSS